MDERAPLIVAFLVGALAVGGLSLMSRKRERAVFTPRVVAQTLVPARSAPTTIPAGVRIDLRPSPALLKLAGGGDVWEYRVVDASGRLYAKDVNADEKTRGVFVPLGYGRSVVSPRLETWYDGERLASVPLGPMPAPFSEPMLARQSDRIRAFHSRRAMNRPDGQCWSNIQFVPTGMLNPKEAWSVDMIETPLRRESLKPQKDLATSAPRSVYDQGWALNSGSLGNWVLYGDDVNAVRIRVTRSINRVEKAQVSIPGLRLFRQAGQTSIRSNALVVPNALGLYIRIVPSKRSYERSAKDAGVGTSAKDADGDHRAPILNIDPEPRPGARKSTLRFNSGSLKIVDPNVGDLHLRALFVSALEHRFGTAAWHARGPVLVPVATKPFALEVEVTTEWTEILETFEVTIPVEPAPK